MKKMMYTMLIGTGLAFAGTGLNCANVKEMMPNEIEHCVEQTDEVLNANYKELMDTYKELPVQKKALKKTQRAWLKFRDAECEYQLSGLVSSTREAEYNICVVELTVQRNEMLEAYLQ